MDPIAHTLVGASLSQTGLGRKSAGAAAALVIGANLPDVDGLAMLAGPDTALLLRRGWTHGVPALVLLPLLLTSALLLWYRTAGRHRAALVRPGALLALSSLAVATHPTLDWMNTYGMRWWMPLEGRWFYGDTLFIVDPWMWLLLGGAVFLAHSRTLSSRLAWALFAAGASYLLVAAVEGLFLLKALWLAGLGGVIALRARSGGSHGRLLARGAVVLVSGYVLAMSALARHARSEVASSLESRGIEVERLMVGPVPVTPFVRDVVVETPDGYRYGRARLFPFSLDLAPRTLPLLEDAPRAVEAAFASPSIRGFRNWARFPFAEVEPGPRGVTVHFFDARYTRSRRNGFGSATVEVPELPASGLQ